MNKTIPILLAVACLRSAAVDSFYVEKTGSDTNPGSATEPFLTVTKAVRSARAGDSVIIGEGYYEEDVRTSADGTEESRITIDGQGLAQIRSIFLFNAFNTVQNLKISGKTNQFLIFVYAGGDNCILSNNVVDGDFQRLNLMQWNGSSAKPFGDAGSDNLVISNTFTHGFGGLVIASYGDRNKFVGNKILDCDSVDLFRVFGRSNIIAGNLCSNVFESGRSGNHVDFFQVFGTQGFASQGTLIENNTVRDMSGASQLCMMTADDVTDIRDFTFRNNIFVGISAKGTIAVPDTKFYNNLFWHCSTNDYTGGPVLVFTDTTSVRYPNREANSAHGARVFNNIFLDCGGAKNAAGWYGFDAKLTNDIAADYNYVSKNGYQPVVIDSLRRAVGTPGGGYHTAWWEPNGVNGGDPLFFDLPSLDFRFVESSPLTGAAAPLNNYFKTDRIGTTRGSKWDIGPNEYGCDYGGNVLDHHY